MSRQIPEDKTLSEEDRRYLLERGQESKIAYLDQQYPPDPQDLADFEAKLRGEIPPDYTGDRGAVLGLQARVAQLEEFIEELGADVPPAPGEVTEEEAEYADWKLADLQKEAGARGLSKSGTKDELAARLQAHDDSDGQ